jgi:Flp pilus assembly protein TadG
MAKDRSDSKGFLARLLHDRRGNILAMTAAGIIPLIGLVGGAVDMGRLYAVKSRLQSACDAGALAGRRVMGTGRWTDNSGRPNQVALNTFDLNFTEGSFGSENRTRAFTETDGTVSGTATANVPMTLMRVFDMPEKTVTVTCEGMMRIPNTDVMFVLDNSGSMDQVIPGDTTGLQKMAGLQRAIRCFYEALAKVNISEVTPAECGTTADPTAGLSSQVQLRFGFVNYDHMVNVGKLLPQNDLVDRWTYQSRVATTETVQTWTTGTPATPNWTGSWVGDRPASYAYTAAYGSFATVTSSTVTLADGHAYPKTNSLGVDASSCAALNNYGSAHELLGVTETAATPGAATYTATTNDPPVYPASSQNLSASRNRNMTVKGYRYRYFSSACKMEVATATNKYPQTQTDTSNRSVIWAPYDRITKWTYRPVEFTQVASLKNSDGTWASGISIPVGESSVSAKLSGEGTATTLKLVANTSAPWLGCIEERKTFQNTDGNPSDDWLSYPTSPSDAIDMDIDRVPSVADDNTRWRPALPNAVWGRKETLVDKTWSGNNTMAWVEGNAYAATGAPGRNTSNNNCGVTPSRRLMSYDGRNGNPTAQDFSTYVGTITPNGNTYHDIGLLWGARLMSPTGIFASDNATTPGGAQITRHLIFMTDGDTATTNINYDSYGISWWDRRQFNTAATDTQNNNNNNARSNALCTAIKNRNITLWVITYGGGTNSTTNTRLRNCATSSTYFFDASNTTTLIAKFREIADRISNLRLTN